MRNISALSQILVLVPWVTFWNQGGSQLSDLSKIRTAIAADKNCKKIVRSFQATIARTNESRARGLGGRSTPMSKDEAMLFIFEQPQPLSFWMKETLIPLDIGYFDAKGTLRETYFMPVEADPKNPAKLYGSLGPMLAALETQPGSLKGLKVGSHHLCADTLPTP